MDLVVPIIVAVLAGGGVGGLITAWANSRKTGAETERTTVETFGSEWRAIVEQLREQVSALAAAERQCRSTLDVALQTVAELRVGAATANAVVTRLGERLDAIETRSP